MLNPTVKLTVPPMQWSNPVVTAYTAFCASPTSSIVPGTNADSYAKAGSQYPFRETLSQPFSAMTLARDIRSAIKKVSNITHVPNNMLVTGDVLKSAAFLMANQHQEKLSSDTPDGLGDVMSLAPDQAPVPSPPSDNGPATPAKEPTAPETNVANDTIHIAELIGDLSMLVTFITGFGDMIKSKVGDSEQHVQGIKRAGERTLEILAPYSKDIKLMDTFIREVFSQGQLNPENFKQMLKALNEHAPDIAGEICQSWLDRIAAYELNNLRSAYLKNGVSAWEDFFTLDLVEKALTQPRLAGHRDKLMALAKHPSKKEHVPKLLGMDMGFVLGKKDFNKEQVDKIVELLTTDKLNSLGKEKRKATPHSREQFDQRDVERLSQLETATGEIPVQNTVLDGFVSLASQVAGVFARDDSVLKTWLIDNIVSELVNGQNIQETELAEMTRISTIWESFQSSLEGIIVGQHGSLEDAVIEANQLSAKNPQVTFAVTNYNDSYVVWKGGPSSTLTKGEKILQIHPKGASSTPSIGDLLLADLGIITANIVYRTPGDTETTFYTKVANDIAWGSTVVHAQEALARSDQGNALSEGFYIHPHLSPTDPETIGALFIQIEDMRDAIRSEKPQYFEQNIKIAERKNGGLVNGKSMDVGYYIHPVRVEGRQKLILQIITDGSQSTSASDITKFSKPSIAGEDTIQSENAAIENAELEREKNLGQLVGQLARIDKILRSVNERLQERREEFDEITAFDDEHGLSEAWFAVGAEGLESQHVSNEPSRIEQLLGTGFKASSDEEMKNEEIEGLRTAQRAKIEERKNELTEEIQGLEEELNLGGKEKAKLEEGIELLARQINDRREKIEALEATEDELQEEDDDSSVLLELPWIAEWNSATPDFSFEGFTKTLDKILNEKAAPASDDAAKAPDKSQEVEATPNADAAKAPDKPQEVKATPNADAAKAPDKPQEVKATPNTDAAKAPDKPQEVKATPNADAAKAPDKPQNAEAAESANIATDADHLKFVENLIGGALLTLNYGNATGNLANMLQPQIKKTTEHLDYILGSADPARSLIISLLNFKMGIEVSQLVTVFKIINDHSDRHFRAVLNNITGQLEGITEDSE